MKRKIVALMVLPAFLMGCGTYENEDVTPLDDGTPMPECVTIEFSTVANWDGRETNERATTYCQKEID